MLWIGAGIAALGAYGFVATLQADANFGRILAAYGGVFGLTEASVGKPAPVNDTIERITGHPARTYAEWAADHPVGI